MADWPGVRPSPTLTRLDLLKIGNFRPAGPGLGVPCDDAGVFGASHVPTISVSDLPTDGRLLDVREDDEWWSGRAPGAVHMPLQTLPDRLGELPTDEPVYVICRSGSRSAYAVAWLVQQGIDAFNVAGGMVEWQELGKPMVGDSEEPYVW